MSVHDLWAGRPASERTGKRWEARWRHQGRQHKRRFSTKSLAEAHDAKMRLEPEVVLAQQRRRLTVDAMMDSWLASKQGLRPASRDAAAYAHSLVLAQFRGRLASSVSPAEVRVWTARDGNAWTRRRTLLALGQAYRLSIGDGLLDASPCVGIPQPRVGASSKRALTWAELERLAAESGEYAPLIWLLGTVGLRIGEAAGLQVGDITPSTGRMRIARQVTWTSQGPTDGLPKGMKAREVAVPRSVLAQLPLEGRRPDDWLFTGDRGGRMAAPWWRAKRFTPAVRAAGLAPLTPHELRHTAASLAIKAGASVLDVQRMLGHASPTVTLGLYAHWFDGGLDDVAQRMDEGREAS